MARETRNTKQLKCKLKDVAPDPMNPGRTIVSFEFDDGSDDGPWVQGFSMLPPDRPLSLEELILKVKEYGIKRPTDPFVFVREELEKGKEFTIDMAKETDPKE